MIRMRDLRTTIGLCALLGIGASFVAFGEQKSVASNEWPTYGHDPGGMRYSPLTQITPANVARLEKAWVYHMKPPASGPPPADPAPAGPPEGRGRGGRGGAAGLASGETTPLVINGTMYVS